MVGEGVVARVVLGDRREGDQAEQLVVLVDAAGPVGCTLDDCECGSSVHDGFEEGNADLALADAFAQQGHVPFDFLPGFGCGLDFEGVGL